MKQLLSLLCTVVLVNSGTAFSQNISPDVSSRYNASIVSRVYEISKYASLNPKQQMALAVLYNKKDSTIAGMLLAGKQKEEIETVTKQFDNQLYVLEGVKSYFDSVSASAARKVAGDEIRFVQEYYKADSSVTKELSNMIFAKYRQLFRDMLQGPDKIQGMVYQRTAVAATMINQSLEVVQHSFFLKNYLKDLDGIKVLPDSVKQKVSERFLRLCGSNKLGRVENMENALRSYVTDTSIYARLFQKQIQQQAQLAVRTEQRQFARYKTSRECIDEIKQLLDDKHYQLALVNQAYGILPRKRDSLYAVISSRQDSLVDVALLRDGALINSSLFSAALRMKNQIKLTGGQVDSLLVKGMYLNRLKDSAWRVNPLFPYDTKDFENNNLSRILNEEQFAALLMIRYQPDARKNAENDWKDLEERELTKNLDKEKTLQQLTFYYISVKSSSSMYAYDLNKQSAYARSVKDNMPQALKLLQYARKNNITAANLPSTIKW